MVDLREKLLKYPNQGKNIFKESGDLLQFEDLLNNKKLFVLPNWPESWYRYLSN